MNSDQAINAIDELSMLFPKAELEQAELKLFTESIGKFDYSMFVEVVRDHRLHNDFYRPKIGHILSEVEKRHVDKCGRRETASTAVTHGETIRQHRQAHGDPKAAAMTAPEACIRHRAWVARQAATERLGADGRVERVLSPLMSASIRWGCNYDLVVLGVASTNAARIAEAVADPNLSISDLDRLVREINVAT